MGLHPPRTELTMEPLNRDLARHEVARRLREADAHRLRRLARATARSSRQGAGR